MEKKIKRLRLTREELTEVLLKHKQWLYTGGKEGERADLSYMHLQGSNLLLADLRQAMLMGTDLSCADLRGADLFRANLQGANLKGADLFRANLLGTNLTDVDIPMVCPENGSFIGWKHAGGYIVKLEIPEDAKRSSGTGSKCRCNKATVLAIENMAYTATDETEGVPADVTEVHSDYDENFIYRVGETVTVDDFDDNRFNECAPGIHFYMDRDDVVYYYC